MNLLASAARVTAALDRLGRRHCVIGGVALQRWGAPRATLDVDLTVLVEFGAERRAAIELLQHFTARIVDAENFAVRNRVLLVRDSDSVPIDIAFGAMPFEERSVDRSSVWVVGAERVRTCSAEDLVVHKAFANRAQDWVDIDSVIIRQPSLDWALIETELRPLLDLKEIPEVWDDLVRRRK